MSSWFLFKSLRIPLCRQFSEMSTKSGFFVVINGFHPGIYRSHAEALEQVTGYENGSFKKFATYDDAYYCYFHNRSDNSGEQQKTSEIVAKRLKQGLAEQLKAKEKNPETPCLLMASDISGNTANISPHPFFSSPPQSTNDARTSHDLVEESSSSINQTVMGSLVEPDRVRKSSRVRKTKNYDEFTDADNDEFSLAQFEKDIITAIMATERMPKKRKRRNPQLQILKKDKTETTTKDGYRIIYTDGCCLDSSLQSDKRQAGIGVFWGKNDSRNICERLWGDQTNQRAELWAAVRCVQSALLAEVDCIEIRTDSSYVINGATTWYEKWSQNNFLTANKKPVKNKDLFVLLNSLCHYLDVRWVKVKAHSAIVGNDMADALAKCGASLPARGIPTSHPEYKTEKTRSS